MDVTIYVRLSRDKAGDELGIARQEAECRQWVQARGWTVREVIADNDLSATTGVQRPGFEALLTSAPEAVVVWHLDRLIRLTKDLERVIVLGVDVYALQAGQVDLSTPAGRAVARTITAWATYEGEIRNARQRAQQRQRAEAGKRWWTVRPFGYEMDGTLREPEAQALRQVYADLLVGGSLHGLVRGLNDAGWKTTHGVPWRRQSLRVTLLAARNAGILTHKGEEVGPGDWTPLVEEETYRAAVRLLTAPGRRTGAGGRVTTLLSGIATCGPCGGPLRGSSSGTGELIYECQPGKHVRANREWLDSMVVWHLFVKRPKGLGSDTRGGDAAALRAQEMELRGRLAALTEDYAEGLINREQMRSGTLRLRERLEETEAALTRAAAEVSLLDEDDLDYAFYAWDELPLERQRMTVKSAMKAVALHRMPKGRRSHGPEDVKVTWRV